VSLEDLIAAIADLDPADAPAVLAAVAAQLAQLGQRPSGADDPAIKGAEYLPDESLTIEEAAACLRRSTKWIYRHRARLPFVRKIGPRSYLCSKSALLRWRDRQHA